MMLILIAVLTAACDTVGTTPTPRTTVTVDFAEQPDDWTALFSNYDPARVDSFDLESDYRSLPEPLDTTRSAFYLAGTNRSDDLNMHLKHRVDDLEPETTYEVSFEVTFATEVPSRCVGVGGSPGESVTVHATAASIEPQRDTTQMGSHPYTRLNLVEQYTGDNWYRGTQLGTIANSRDCEDGFAFETKRLRSERDHARVTTDSTGQAWLLVGTRSGFEARTQLYYTEVEANFY
jgi:hypothetical protein